MCLVFIQKSKLKTSKKEEQNFREKDTARTHQFNYFD